jgi:hypothetical protein
MMAILKHAADSGCDFAGNKELQKKFRAGGAVIGSW